MRSNQARARNNTNSNTNHNTKANSNDGQVKRWLPKEKWNIMYLKQRRQHLNKFRRSINSNSSNISEMPQEVQQKSLPSQYNTANSVTTDKESKLYNFMTILGTQSIANSTITNISTQQQKVLDTYDQNVNVNKLLAVEQ